MNGWLVCLSFFVPFKWFGEVHGEQKKGFYMSGWHTVNRIPGPMAYRSRERSRLIDGSKINRKRKLSKVYSFRAADVDPAFCISYVVIKFVQTMFLWPELLFQSPGKGAQKLGLSQNWLPAVKFKISKQLGNYIYKNYQLRFSSRSFGLWLAMALWMDGGAGWVGG